MTDHFLNKRINKFKKYIMKKEIIIRIVFTVFLFNYFNVFSQTNIPSGNVSGLWTITGSPYQIQGSIMIPNDSTLTIEPGVTINFQGAYKLYVQGRIIAIGNAIDTILFTAANITNGWKGIRFDNTPTTNDTSKFYYCKIQYGKATISPDNIGGAFYFNNFSKAIISNCTITNCFANNNGAGIYGTSSSPIITNNVISYNTTPGYGGAGLFFNNSQPLISMNKFFNNEATDAFGRGGALSCYSCTGAIIDSNTFTGNVAFRGGSIFCSSGSATITNNSYTNNIAPIGAGICLEFSNPTIYQNYFSNNSGNVIYCEGTNPTISNNDISNNNGIGIICSINNSGNIPTITNNNIHNNYGGGISCHISSPIISYNFITNNTALKGGAIKCTDNTTPLNISNNVISNNTADSLGGAVYCSNSSPSFSNNTITNNLAIKGGAIYCTLSSDPNITNTIIWGNTATTSGNQVYLEDEASDPNFNYCNVQGGTSVFGLNGIFFTGAYSNNVNTDPLFVLPSGGSGIGFNGVTADWSLQIGSPCINAGNPSGTYSSADIVGNPRVIDGTIDIGAYEFQGGTSIEVISQDLFSVFPNPTYDNIEIIGLENGKIEIINAHGQIIKTINELNKETIVDLSKCATGLYLIKATFDNRIGIKTIIKQ